MDRRYAIYMFAGLAIGALFGSGVGSANGNVLMGLAIGALIGVAIGWFGAAAMMERDKSK